MAGDAVQDKSAGVAPFEVDDPRYLRVLIKISGESLHKPDNSFTDKIKNVFK